VTTELVNTELHMAVRRRSVPARPLNETGNALLPLIWCWANLFPPYLQFGATLPCESQKNPKMLLTLTPPQQTVHTVDMFLRALSILIKY